MLLFTLRRLGAAIVLLFVVLTASFFLLHLAPGEPSVLFSDTRMSADQRDHLRRLYGLDQPLGVQYARWLSAVTRGDLGVSIGHRRPAVDVLFERLPNTAILALGALVVEYTVGLGLGLGAAARTGGRTDLTIRVLALVAYSVPTFWLALLAIDVLAVRWGLFPVGQMSSDSAAAQSPALQLADRLHHLVLPSLALGLSRCGAVARFVRNGLLEILEQDYIRTARMIGLGRGRILFVHALRNALGPVVQRFGTTLPSFLSGSVVIEVIFSWPGLGQATYAAVLERDYPLVMAATALTGVLVVAATFLTDLLHAWTDPRVRHAIR